MILYFGACIEVCKAITLWISSGITAPLGKTHDHEGGMIFAGVWVLTRCLLSILKL